jgi:hypothetical protein
LRDTAPPALQLLCATWHLSKLSIRPSTSLTSRLYIKLTFPVHSSLPRPLCLRQPFHLVHRGYILSLLIRYPPPASKSCGRPLSNSPHTGINIRTYPRVTAWECIRVFGAGMSMSIRRALCPKQLSGTRTLTNTHRSSKKNSRHGHHQVQGSCGRSWIRPNLDVSWNSQRFSPRSPRSPHGSTSRAA